MKFRSSSLFFLAYLVASLPQPVDAIFFGALLDAISAFFGSIVDFFFGSSSGGTVCWDDNQLTAEGTTFDICESSVLTSAFEAGWCFEQVANSECAQGGLYSFISACTGDPFDFDFKCECTPCIVTYIVITNVDPSDCRATALYHQHTFHQEDSDLSTSMDETWTGYAHKVGDEIAFCQMEGSGPNEKWSSCALRAPSTGLFQNNPLGNWYDGGQTQQNFETEAAKVCAAFL